MQHLTGSEPAFPAESPVNYLLVLVLFRANVKSLASKIGIWCKEPQTLNC